MSLAHLLHCILYIINNSRVCFLDNLFEFHRIEKASFQYLNDLIDLKDEEVRNIKETFLKCDGSLGEGWLWVCELSPKKMKL